MEKYEYDIIDVEFGKGVRTKTCMVCSSRHTYRADAIKCVKKGVNDKGKDGWKPSGGLAVALMRLKDRGDFQGSVSQAVKRKV